MRLFRFTAVTLLAVLVVVPSHAATSTSDHTLLVAEYVKRGMPADDRVWFSRDYEAALAVFNALPDDQLPNASSRRSGALLKRLVDPSSLLYFSDHSIPLNVRMSECLTLGDAISAIMRRYLAAQQNAPSRGEDVILVAGYSLEAAAAQTRLVEEFLPTLNPADSKYRNRMAGLEQMKQGFAGMLSSSITMIDEGRSAFPEQSRVHLAKVLGEVYPTMSLALPPHSKAEIRARLAKLARADSNPEVRKALAAFLPDVH